MSKRYTVVDESLSGHCCFKFSIVDRNVIEYEDGEGDGKYETICETFHKKDADKICSF